MEHLFIELMVKEKQDAALKGLAEQRRYTCPVQTPRPPFITRMMDRTGDTLIRFGEYLKTRYGRPASCLVTAQARQSGLPCSRGIHTTGEVRPHTG